MDRNTYILIYFLYEDLHSWLKKKTQSGPTVCVYKYCAVYAIQYVIDSVAIWPYLSFYI